MQGSYLSQQLCTWMAAEAPGRGATCKGSSGGFTMLFSPQHQTVPSARGKISGSETLPAAIGQNALQYKITHEADKQVAAAVSAMELQLLLQAVHQEFGFFAASSLKHAPDQHSILNKPQVMLLSLAMLRFLVEQNLDFRTVSVFVDIAITARLQRTVTSRTVAVDRAAQDTPETQDGNRFIMQYIMLDRQKMVTRTNWVSPCLHHLICSAMKGTGSLQE